ncbi:hypothetical protein FGO68_gene2469 [Halteria grandinella]|uniref:Uncharacterized protein n=1 Tax=Halteria grandinella TaxID=5974 RepID=A0A8J8NFR0_HALGN|nr:hypothetical protein FGO68_gene2469 [Halteria grandinella]
MVSASSIIPSEKQPLNHQRAQHPQLQNTTLPYSAGILTPTSAIRHRLSTSHYHNPVTHRPHNNNLDLQVTPDGIDSTIMGKSMRIAQYDQKFNTRLPFNFLALQKKSVEVGDDGTLARMQEMHNQQHSSSRRQFPNTDDLAPVYTKEQIKQSLAHIKSRYNASYEEQQSRLQKQLTEEYLRQNSQLQADVARMDGMLRANYLFDSFQKNNVRKDMIFKADSFFIDPLQLPVTQALPSNLLSPADFKKDDVTPTSGLDTSMQVQSDMKNNFVTFDNQARAAASSSHLIRTEIPHQSALIKAYSNINASNIVHDEGIRSNPHISTITSVQSSNNNQILEDKKNSSHTLAISQASLKHKENFTIHMPPLIGNPPGTTMTEDFTSKGQTSPQTVYKLDTQRLHRDESDEVIILRGDTMQPMIINVNEVGTQSSPRITIPIFTYHAQQDGPIQSVYEAETEAKQRGLIRQMIFVPPINHEQPVANKNLTGSPHRGGKAKKKSTAQPTMWIGLQQTTLGSRKSPTYMTPPPQFVIPDVQPEKTHRILEPFTEEDDVLAQKLMKELMPNNFLQMKKRGKRNLSSQILSATYDSTLRLTKGMAKRGLGIRKLEPKDVKNTLSGQYAVNTRDLPHLSLISYCIGTAPVKYKIDVPMLNNQVMNLFTEDDKGTGNILSQDQQDAILQEVAQLQDKDGPPSQSPNHFKHELDLRQGIHKINSNMDQFTEELPQNNSTLEEATTPQRVNSSIASKLMVNGQGVTKNGEKRKVYEHRTQVITRSGIHVPRLSHINLVQDVNDLRSKGEKFMNATPSHHHRYSVTGAENFKQMLIAEGDESLPSASGHNELQNVGIKTTISITHHNQTYSSIAAHGKNQDLIGVQNGAMAPPMSINDEEQKLNDSSQQSPKGYLGPTSTFGGAPVRNSQRSVVSKRGSIDEANNSPQPPSYMQPLGTTLRSKRRRATEEQPLVKTTTTVNYDSRTGLQHVTETTSPMIHGYTNIPHGLVIVSSPNSRKELKEELGLIRLASCEPANQGHTLLMKSQDGVETQRIKNNETNLTSRGEKVSNMDLVGTLNAKFNN